MKRLVMIGVVVMVVLAMTVPAALAAPPPPGNTTRVTVNGWHNAGTVVVQGSGNYTSLYYAPKSKWNVGVIGVVGCRNSTSLSFGYRAKYNHVGVVVVSPCP